MTYVFAPSNPNHNSSHSLNHTYHHLVPFSVLIINVSLLFAVLHKQDTAHP